MIENKIEVKQVQAKDLISLLLSKIYIIIIFAIIGAVSMFVKSQYFTNESYVSDGALVVSNITDDVRDSGVKQYLTSSDMDSSRSLSYSCMQLLLRRGFFQIVSDDIGNKYSPSQLKGMVSILPVNDTEVLNVTVVAATKEDAYLVCNSVIKNAPEWIESIYDFGLVKIADDAYIPAGPLPRNTEAKAIIGFLIGAVVGIFLILIFNFFDDKIKRGSDISDRYGIPLLGEFNQ